MKNNFIIDTHAHIGYWPTLTLTKLNLLKSINKYHISYTLISFDGTEFKEDNISKKFTEQIEGSKKLLSFIKRHKHTGMLVWVRPHTENNYEEVDEFIKENIDYIHGIKFHPFCSRMKITNKKFIPYLDIARKYNLPILVHTAGDKFSQIKYLKEVALKNPDIIFVAAHMELETDHMHAIEVMVECKNIYADTAWVNMRTLRKLKKLNLMDRVMFGTDNPIDGEDTLNNPIYQDYFKNYIKLNRSDYNKVMYQNAMNIYKINEKDLKIFKN